MMGRLADSQVAAGLVQKLMRRQITEGVRFREDIKYAEDLLFLMEVLWKDRNMRISYLPKAFYHYVQNPGSIMHTLSPQVVLTGKKVGEWMDEQPGMNEEWTYKYKAGTLSNLFKCGGFSYLLSTHPEVHRRYIREHRGFHVFSPWAPCLAIALRGYPRAAYCLCQLCLGLVRVKESIQRIWRK